MDIQRLLKEAQKMQSSLQKVEKELEDSQYEGKSGPVTVVINGNHNVVSVDIDEEIWSADNKEMLQDMIMLAINDANKKASDERENKMSSLTAGVKMPGVF